MLRIGTLVLAVLAACDFSLCIGATGSHVPYKSLVELRAASMPDAAWAVSGIPQADPGGMATPGFDIVYSLFDTSSAVRLRSPLPTSPAGIVPNVSCNAYHHRF